VRLARGVRLWQPSGMTADQHRTAPAGAPPGSGGGRPGAGEGGRAAESGTPGAGLGEVIARLRRALRRAARAADPGNTLAVAQFELLGCVLDHPGVRPGRLAGLLNLRPNTVTTLVNALAAQGMIDRTSAPDDRRAILLSVTEAGAAAVTAWQSTNSDVLERALAALPTAQRTALERALPALAALSVEIDRLGDGAPPA